MALTPQEAARRGRIGALKLHSKYDSRYLTSKAREAFLQRFEDEVDPNRELTEAERTRRAESARRAYFSKLAHKSAQARRSRKNGGGDA